jgi:hypothetical protein
MKIKSLIGLAVVLLCTTGAAQSADDKSKNITDQNISKRPYQQVPETSANKDAEFEGATLVKESEVEKEGPNKYQQLRIRMLGRSPYMEKSQ